MKTGAEEQMVDAVGETVELKRLILLSLFKKKLRQIYISLIYIPMTVKL